MKGLLSKIISFDPNIELHEGPEKNGHPAYSFKSVNVELACDVHGSVWIQIPTLARSDEEIRERCRQYVADGRGVRCPICRREIGNE